MKKGNITKQPNTENNNLEITRKEAIKKTGKYAAVTAAAMFIVLSPKESQALSGTPEPGWGSGL